MNLKVCTLNLWGFNDWEQRQTAIVDYLKNTDPDVVFFQEVIYDPEVSAQTQVSLLNKVLDYKYEYVEVPRSFSNDKAKNHREGLAALSKHRVAKSETLALRKNEADKHVRIVQMLDIQVGSSAVQFANVHFSSQTEFSRAHLQELLGLLDGRDEERIIIGDFNMLLPDEDRGLFEKSYILSTDFVSYISYPEKSETLDYILLPKDCVFHNIDTSTENLSDHNAVTAEISI